MLCAFSVINSTTDSEASSKVNKRQEEVVNNSRPERGNCDRRGDSRIFFIAVTCAHHRTRAGGLSAPSGDNLCASHDILRKTAEIPFSGQDDDLLSLWHYLEGDVFGFCDFSYIRFDGLLGFRGGAISECDLQNFYIGSNSNCYGTNMFAKSLLYDKLME